MKKIAVALMMVSMLVFAGSAMALTCPDCYVTLTDDPNLKIIHDGTPSYYQKTFDITVGAHPYQPGVDSIDYAYVQIWLKDDNDTSYESGQILLDGHTKTTSIGYNSFDVDSYLNDGILIVRVTATAGDFIVDYVQLDVRFDDCPTTGVPEPSTMLLLGFGLAGAAYARKRFRK